MSIIGVDIDGTLAEWKGFIAPDVIGAPDPHMVQVIKHLHDQGNTICAWSCRANYVVEKWLVEYGLRDYFQYINASPGTTDSIKPSFDFYIGDEALEWHGG